MWLIEFSNRIACTYKALCLWFTNSHTNSINVYWLWGFEMIHTEIAKSLYSNESQGIDTNLLIECDQLTINRINLNMLLCHFPPSLSFHLNLHLFERVSIKLKANIWHFMRRVLTRTNNLYRQLCRHNCLWILFEIASNWIAVVCNGIGIFSPAKMSFSCLCLMSHTSTRRENVKSKNNCCQILWHHFFLFLILFASL